MSGHQHVLYRRTDERWIVRTEGTPWNAPVPSFERKLAAIIEARARAKKNDVDLVIHARNGRILEIDSYQNRAKVENLLPRRR